MDPTRHYKKGDSKSTKYFQASRSVMIICIVKRRRRRRIGIIISKPRFSSSGGNSDRNSIRFLL